MLVSLCMIAYNEEKVLNGLFRDFSMQDYPHDQIEVVLVDSNSNDKTRKMMEDFKNTDYGGKGVCRGAFRRSGRYTGETGKIPAYDL